MRRIPGRRGVQRGHGCGPVSGSRFHSWDATRREDSRRPARMHAPDARADPAQPPRRRFLPCPLRRSVELAQIPAPPGGVSPTHSGTPRHARHHRLDTRASRPRPYEVVIAATVPDTRINALRHSDTRDRRRRPNRRATRATALHVRDQGATTLSRSARSGTARDGHGPGAAIRRQDMGTATLTSRRPIRPRNGRPCGPKKKKKKKKKNVTDER